MTTLAYRDGVLAFDSQSTSGSTILSLLKQKGIATRKHLAAVSGPSAYGESFLGWVKAGLDPTKVPLGHDGKIDEIAALVIDRGLRVYEYHDNLLPNSLGRLPFHAVGSGRDIALGAMAAGASAIEAVRIAAKYDVYTGGRIRSVSFT